MEKLGWCNYGVNCRFAHSKEELQVSNNHYIFTKPCFFFSKTGKCKYGNKCTYVHLSKENFDQRKYNQRIGGISSQLNTNARVFESQKAAKENMIMNLSAKPNFIIKGQMNVGINFPVQIIKTFSSCQFGTLQHFL